MALPTVAVLVQVLGPDGAPVVGAAVSALLTRTDRDLGTTPASWLFPATVTATTDAEGAATLALWPNARGEDGSAYRFSVVDAAGVLVLDLVAAVPDEDCTLADLTAIEDGAPPFPVADPTRAARVLQDVVDLLAESDPSTETQRKVARWINLVLLHMENRRPWKFADALVETTLGRGVDVFDLTGTLRAVKGLWGRLGPLSYQPLSAIQEARARAALHGGINGGPPQWYALEGLRRVHLFPVPREDEPLALLYQRPLTVDMIPDACEVLLVNGVLGRYGRHFDRDALSQDPEEFEARFERELVLAGRGSWDATVIAPGLMLREPLAEAVPRVAQGQVQVVVP